MALGLASMAAGMGLSRMRGAAQEQLCSGQSEQATQQRVHTIAWQQAWGLAAAGLLAMAAHPLAHPAGGPGRAGQGGPGLPPPAR